MAGKGGLEGCRRPAEPGRDWKGDVGEESTAPRPALDLDMGTRKTLLPTYLGKYLYILDVR